jgi:hypothetical protein
VENTTAERINRQTETVHQSIERQAQGLCCIAAYFYVAPLCRLWLNYVKSQRGRRNGNVLTERQFGIQFTELFPDYDAHGKKQTATNGRFKHVIGVKGKEIGLGNKQYDAYDIPPVAELRAI